MLRRLLTAFRCWYRRGNNYKVLRMESCSKAVTMAQRLINSGALQGSRMTGNPLVADFRRN